MPEIDAGRELTEILFKLGPIRGEMPLCEEDLEPWERRRGITLHPWQAELVVEMSKSYMGEMHAAREPSALSPWPKARAMWMHVTGKIFEEQQKSSQKKKEDNGSRKRH